MSTQSLTTRTRKLHSDLSIYHELFMLMMQFMLSDVTTVLFQSYKMTIIRQTDIFPIINFHDKFNTLHTFCDSSLMWFVASWRFSLMGLLPNEVCFSWGLSPFGVCCLLDFQVSSLLQACRIVRIGCAIVVLEIVPDMFF